MRTLIKILSVLVFLSLCVLAGLFFLPWKGWVESQIQTTLQARGFENVDLHIADVTFDKIILKDISLQGGQGLSLKNLALDYSLRDLWHGKIDELVLQDLLVDVRQNEGIWSVNGIKPAEGGSAFLIPDTQEAIAQIPVSRFKLENSQLDMVTEDWHLSVPIQMNWDRGASSLSVLSQNIALDYQDMNITAYELKGDVSFKDGIWQGDWVVNTVTVPDYPFLQLQGTLKIQDQVIEILGTAATPDKTTNASFKIIYPLRKPLDMKVILSQGNMVWGGGKIGLKNVLIPMDGKSNFKFNLDVEKIAVQDLMKLVTGRPIVASGTISGKVPIIIRPNGTITLETGRLAANENGLISMPPDVIPGAGSQIDLTRQILENFQYDGLSIDVQADKYGKVALLLALSGNNPKVYDGRAVKLNVRLGGDVLEFLQSNIMMFTKPESILQQE